MKLLNKLIPLALVSSLLATSLFAEHISLKYPIKDLGTTGTNAPNQNGYANSNSGSSSNSSDQAVIFQETQKNDFEMTSDESIFQKAINSRDRYNKLLSETLNLDFMMQPEIRPFKTMDTIYVHTAHITNIVLPDDIQVKKANASFKTDVFELNENTISIKPNRDFNTGNIVVTATNKKQNFIFNIVVKKIEIGSISFDSDYNKYLVEDNYLSLVYKYERKQIEDKFAILQKYLKVNGIDSSDLDFIFKKEGDYDMLIYKGITYYIIKDSRFGSINYGDVDFRVDTKYSFASVSNKIKRLKND